LPFGRECLFNSFVEKGETTACNYRSDAGLRGVPQKLAGGRSDGRFGCGRFG
jgi:hypothetical protein